MKILFLCGVFAKENEQEIIEHSAAPIEYSANTFQERLISGFRALGEDFEVVSAPFIGSYPDKSDIFYFRGFKNKQTKYRYVPFCNLWGFRNFSRADSLKKAIQGFIEDPADEKLIVAYSAHTPFVEAAAYAKEKDPRIKINLIVPDLPQYMNLNSKVSLLYKIGKKYDIRRFDRLNRQVDSYVLLTEYMKEKLNVGNKPYIIAEGIVDNDIFEKNRALKKRINKDKSCRYIVYTGKMNEKFGVKQLVEAFMEIPSDDCRLVLCGCGELDGYIREKAQQDKRIIVKGQVTPDVAHEWILRADVLVNPRQNNNEYTKYSFPSKNIEYLASGNPVVGYMLSGMSDSYADFMIIADGDEPKTALKNAVISALENNKDTSAFEEYARSNLSAAEIIKKIIDLYRM